MATAVQPIILMHLIGSQHCQILDETTKSTPGTATYCLAAGANGNQHTPASQHPTQHQQHYQAAQAPSYTEAHHV
jgi:hypothetical protein